jgi:hypothetical protein
MAEAGLFGLVVPAAAAAANALAARAVGSGPRGERGLARGRLVELEDVSVRRPFSPL